MLTHDNPLESRLKVRIESLVNRGHEICPEWQYDGFNPHCKRCGYMPDVHLLRDCLAVLSQSETPAPDPRTALVEKLALEYHKTVEGEYGCPGITCPGVQRIITLLLVCADELAALRETPQTPTFANIKDYIAHCEKCEATGEDQFVSIAFIRASNATAREFAELDEALGTPMDGTDEEAQVYRLKRIAALRETPAPKENK